MTVLPAEFAEYARHVEAILEEMGAARFNAATRAVVYDGTVFPDPDILDALVRAHAAKETR